MDSANQVSNCIINCNLFTSLNNNEIEYLLENTVTINYRAGEKIFKQNSPFTHLVIVKSGFTKMFLEGYDKNLILAIIAPGDVISGPGMWVDNMHHFSLSALSNVEACLIELNAFKKLLHDNGDFSEQFRRDHSFRAIHAFKKMISLTQNYMSGRVAGELINLSKRIFQSDKFDLMLSRQELAELTSMSKESVCRILKEFKDNGLIKFRGSKFEIIDSQKLINFAMKG
jgi:CRP/FNR family transcriptional regulator